MRASFNTAHHWLRFPSLLQGIPSQRARIVSVHRNGGVDLRCWYTRPGTQAQGQPRSGFRIEARGAKDVAMDATGTGKQSTDPGVSQETKPLSSQEVPATIRVSEERGQLEPGGPDSDVRDGVKMDKSIWSKLGQRVNIAGIQFASRIMLWDQHLAVPHISVPDIRWIDWKALHEQGFQGVVFDKDNTLTAPYALAVWPALATSLQECRSIFEGRIALLSNSAGLYQFDPDGVEATALEERLGIPVIRHGTKKPAGTAKDLAKHFGCDPSRLIMVGDRYFTDIVFGNNNGLLTIRPAPLTLVGEPFVVQKVRMFEDAVVGGWLRQKVQPRAHALLTSPHDFIKDSACCNTGIRAGLTSNSIFPDTILWPMLQRMNWCPWSTLRLLWKHDLLHVMPRLSALSSRLESTKKLVLTPFEKNMDIWRQLWRVLERYDLAYATKLDPKRKTMLLLNKSDLLTPDARKKWATFLKEQGIPYMFWSAKVATAILEGKVSPDKDMPSVNEEEADHEDTVVLQREELLSWVQKMAEDIGEARRMAARA